MLREIEAILREIAKSQGIEFPDQRQQEQPRPGKISASGRPQSWGDEENLVEIVDAEPVIEAEHVPEDLVSHVRRHMDTTDVTGHASKLGATIGLADDKLEARLHQTFDHPIGSLGKPLDEPGAVEPPDTLAANIVNMFRNPANLTQAIILSEILTPPSDRW